MKMYDLEKMIQASKDGVRYFSFKDDNDFRDFLFQCEEIDLKWGGSGQKATADKQYRKRYDGSVLVNLNHGEFLSFTTSMHPDCEFEVAEEYEMDLRSLLKSGCVIETKGQGIYEYFDELSVFGHEVCRNIEDSTYFIPCFNEALTDTEANSFSVVKVYKPNHPWSKPNVSMNNYTVIYERKEPVKMTKAEIEKKTWL